MPKVDLIPVEIVAPIEQDTVLSLFFLLFLLCLGVFILMNRGKSYFSYLAGMFNISKMQKYLEDHHQLGFFVPFPLLNIGLNFFITGVVTYWYLWDFIDRDSYLISSLLLAVLVNALPYLHYALIRLTGAVFKLNNYAEKHAIISQYTLNFAGFLSIPLFFYFLNSRNVDAYFTDAYFLISGMLLVGYYVIRVFSAFYKPSFVVWFYIFIYLCTLEVVPLLLIYKVITEIYT